jgi:hypothetical protein
MFKIDSKLQYVYHYTGIRDIAEAVRDNLMSREDCAHPEAVDIEDCKDEPAHWDPGGMLCTSDGKYTFKLLSMNIEVYRQHIQQLTRWINNAKLKDWHGTKYYTVYSGYLHCLCLSPVEFEQLKKQIHSQDAVREGIIGSEIRQSAIEGSGVIQAVRVKDDSGEEKIMRVERKTPVLN